METVIVELHQVAGLVVHRSHIELLGIKGTVEAILVSHGLPYRSSRAGGGKRGGIGDRCDRRIAADVIGIAISIGIRRQANEGSGTSGRRGADRDICAAARCSDSTRTGSRYLKYGDCIK
ncbi:hypothetical protein ACFJIV_28835 [Mucilaginibacter sp. UC70_90]